MEKEMNEQEHDPVTVSVKENKSPSKSTWIVLAVVAVMLITTLCSASVFVVVVGPTRIKDFIQAQVSEPVAAGLAGVVGLEGSREKLSVAAVPELPSLGDLGIGTESGNTAPVPESAPAVAESQDVQSAPAASANDSESAPATTGQGSGNTGGSWVSVPTVVPGPNPVDTDNQIPWPPGLPDDFASMTLEAKTEAMSNLVGLSLMVVPGEEGVAWFWDVKDSADGQPREAFCDGWLICEINLVDGNRDTEYRGPGLHRDLIWAGTFRIEREIPGGGGACWAKWMAEIEHASIEHLISFLGEMSECPELPSQLMYRINPLLAVRLREVWERSGNNGFISIGTVKNGFGAFAVYTGGLGTYDNTECFDGAACAIENGGSWSWVVGPADISGTGNVILFYLDDFSSECEAFSNLPGIYASTVTNAPSCSQ